MTEFSIASDQLFSTVAESIGLIVMVWDLQQDRIQVSPQWQVLTGAPPGQLEMSSAQLGATIHCDDLDAFNAAVVRCLKGSEKFYDAQIRVWRQPGAWQWFSVRGRVVARNDKQRATSVVATFLDANDRKHTERALAESEQRFQSIFETSLHGIIVGTPDGSLVAANPAACRITGYSEAELRRIGRDGLVNPADSRVAELLRARATAGHCSGEVGFVRKDGTPIEVALSSVIYQERSGVTRTSLVLQDVTHTKQVERQFQRLTNLHTTRSRCSHAIAHSASTQQIFDAVCQLLVECNEFGLTWIALGDQHAVSVGAAYGEGNAHSYLQMDEFSLDPNFAAGQGPLGRAIRERTVIVCNDFLGDSSTVPWHARAREHGFRAVAVFPLDRLGSTIGALVLHAPELNYFDAQLVGLLQEVALDISFGMDKLYNEVALSNSEARFRTLWETSPDAILMIDQHSRISYANPAVESLFGYSADEVIGQQLAMLQPKRLRQGHSDGLARYLASGQAQINWRGTNVAGLHRDGHEIPLEVVFTEALIDGARTFTGFMRDITERKRAHELSTRQNRVLQMIGAGAELPDTLGAISEMINELCADVYSALQGLAGEAVDAGWHGTAGLALPFLQERVQAYYLASVASSQNFASVSATDQPLMTLDFEQIEVQADCLETVRRLDINYCSVWPVYGRQHQLLATVSLLFRKARPPTAWERSLLSTAIDLAALAIDNKRSDDRIRHLADTDELTGLPNRARFLHDLTQALARAARNDYQVALLFMDLDRFKNINDTLGHDAGDRVLCEVAQRLRALVREVDIVSRLGGDEFVVVVENLNDPALLSVIAQKLIDQVSQSIDLDGQLFHLSASIGISVYPDDGNDIHALIKNADVAMYRVKETGRNGYQFYAEKMSAGSLERMRLEADLRQAMERDELVLYFQPKLDLRTGAVTGVEALVRWRHPELGLLEPSTFIGLAEETGLIVHIGRWVMHAACAQMRRLIDGGIAPARVAINLSARQFRYEKLVDDIADALQQHGLAPNALELEITESLVMENPEHAVVLLNRCKAMGMHLAMDDFGTGYSSLANLKRFPFDSVKVDRSFIRDLAHDANDAAISRAIIAMAHALRLRVVAEGVETEAQMTFLRQHGCDEIQGYHFARPLSAPALAAFLAANQTVAGAMDIPRSTR